MRSSSRDVPCGSLVTLLPARGDRAASWPGTVQLPAWSESDCSGERHHRAPKRDSRYAPQKRQKDAYQAVLSPFTSSGRLGIYQPLMTSCRKPLRRRRSRCVRDRSRARIAPAPSAAWMLRRILRDWASFSGGLAMAGFLQASCFHYPIVLRCVYTIAPYCYYPIRLYHYYLIMSRQNLIPPAWKCGTAPRYRQALVSLFLRFVFRFYRTALSGT